MDLEASAFNLYSQYGEDGILKAVFGAIGIVHHRAVEFGAWDGVHCANTRALVDEGWICLLIEPDHRRFTALENFAKSAGQVAVEGFVRDRPGQRLHEYLQDAGFPIDLDLVSIDIDGDDLLALSTIGDFSPRCLVIEYNGTIPVDYCYANSPGGNVGNSVSAILKLTDLMEMSLVAQTPTNLIFVKDDILSECTLSVVKPRTQVPVFVGYTGELFIRSLPRKSVDGLDPSVSKLPGGMVHWPWTLGLMSQPIPRVFRRWPRNQFPLALWLGMRALLLHPTSFRALVVGARRYRVKSPS